MPFREGSSVRSSRGAAALVWLKERTLRGTQRTVHGDRKTRAALRGGDYRAGMVRDGGQDRLDDDLDRVGSVVKAVRPHRSDGHGPAWATAGRPPRPG